MSRDLCVEVPAIPAYRVRWADARWEIEQAYALRRVVFCEEQGIFRGDDRDAVDDAAQLLVAVELADERTGAPGQVVGTVRIHESEPGVWYGSRLAVAQPHRRHGRIGATLIRLAVSSAHALGCKRFLAHVQSQNVPLFRRLHWSTLAEEMLLGRPHHLMQANLHDYPPCHTPFAGFAIEGRRGI
ncbi:putative N-acetyltransferase, MSMEG_0567 N-terminal domain family [Cupriavidus sp. YR651]|uniref:MSMEG_0567/Sll0786 family nitrogen starvation N-acetyltransferase n=1 Tax=Cupriavidus sp. YR651 TaxID=1855315 RepID=UPI0008864CEA|nr:MSMEG_0567/Sll0786 family nitrogen starvation N-acetyltransferase [Cupriavidus sp. YR651]SDD56075.1 putative N-acetyltransferase, MSMEG_0567 N-terminal domain family [Cupriavidus sp. YR651]